MTTIIDLSVALRSKRKLLSTSFNPTTVSSAPIPFPLSSSTNNIDRIDPSKPLECCQCGKLCANYDAFVFHWFGESGHLGDPDYNLEQTESDEDNDSNFKSNIGKFKKKKIIPEKKMSNNEPISSSTTTKTSTNTDDSRKRSRLDDDDEDRITFDDLVVMDGLSLVPRSSASSSTATVTPLVKKAKKAATTSIGSRFVATTTSDVSSLDHIAAAAAAAAEASTPQQPESAMHQASKMISEYVTDFKNIREKYNKLAAQSTKCQSAPSQLTELESFDLLKSSKDSYFEVQQQKTNIMKQKETTQMLLQRLQNLDDAFTAMGKVFLQSIGLSHTKVYGKDSPPPQPAHANGSK